MDWILIAIFSYFLFALGNIFEKILRTNHLKSPLSLLFLSGISSFFLLPILPMFFPIDFGNFFLIVLGITVGVTSFAGFLPFLVALKNEETSRLVSLWNFAPIITFILAFFILQERLPENFYLSFTFIFAGGILISFKDLKGNFSTFAFLMMFLSNLLYSISLVIMKYALIFFDFFSVFFYAAIGNVLFILLFFIFGKTRLVIMGDLRKIKQKTTVVAYWFVVILAFFLYYLSVRSGPVSMVAVLGGFQGLFVFLLAFILSHLLPHVLKEDTRLESVSIKVISILLIIVGLYILNN
ncbi:DMT family transporter [Candidatus Micrarchaeota archaeon]|nr:DMT family transporter [Candidatus Micrarchaeota archaeon]